MNSKRKTTGIIKEKNLFTFKKRSGQGTTMGPSDPTGNTIFTIPTLTKFC